MTVGVSVAHRKCEKCNLLTIHKIEYHYYPVNKVIKECSKCGKKTTRKSGSEKK